MPNTLPVPSKAALRTLRNLALGTSCTVAFTTGMLTEDRRRRIHSASEVHANAKKLKSSRKYHSVDHSVGLSSLKTSESQFMRHKDGGMCQMNDAAGSIVTYHPVLLSPESITQLAGPDSEPQPSVPFWPSPSTWKPMPIIPAIWKPIPALSPDPELPTKPPVAKGHIRSRQQRLALDVRRLLQDKEDSNNVDAATARFFEAFEEGLPIDKSGLRKELLDTAIELSVACQTRQKSEAYHKILDLVLENAVIDEATFFDLGAERIVNDLISVLHDTSTEAFTIQEHKLRKAVDLYLVKFKERQKGATDSWRSVGESLCAFTRCQGLYDLTESVYWRVNQNKGETLGRALPDLIAAHFERQLYTKAITSFGRLFPLAHVAGKKFYQMGDMVIKSALSIRRFDLAEEALGVLAARCKDHNKKLPARWFAEVLRTDWENRHDLPRTCSLFDSLAVNLDQVSSPQTVYGAAIQCCVEARDEVAAQKFYERLIKNYGPVDAAHVRILGHFAYAKSLRNDWAGVETDFDKMWQLAPTIQSQKHFEFTENYSASFIPIFKLYAKSHSINKTEEFLRTFIDSRNVKLKPYMSTTIITKYAEAHEIESISRWVDYMVSIGSPPDTMLFNAIISNCQTKWKFSFPDTYRLYRKLRKMDGAATFINDSTFSILRSAAMADARSNVAQAVENLNRMRFDQPRRSHGVNCMGIREQMSVALARGEPEKALRIFKRARATSIAPLDIQSVCIAIQAILQLDPSDVRAAADLLHRPQKDGLDVSSAIMMIFIHQLSQEGGATVSASVQNVARNTFDTLKERGFNVPLQMITHTMHTLNRQGRYGQAVEFWRSMLQCQAAQPSLDLTTLNVLLQAFLGMHDCAGIDWAVQMLQVHELAPDDLFKRALKNSWTEAKKLLGEGSAPAQQNFCRVVESALQRVSAMRRAVVHEKQDFKRKTIMIMEKAIGLQRTTELKGQPMQKRLENADFDDRKAQLSKAWSRSCEHFADVPPVNRLVETL